MSRRPENPDSQPLPRRALVQDTLVQDSQLVQPGSGQLVQDSQDPDVPVEDTHAEWGQPPSARDSHDSASPFVDIHDSQSSGQSSGHPVPAPRDGNDLPRSVGRPVIVARGLCKHFGDFAAVRGIDFNVQAGRCIGLLGPNGAGKTTTMRMIMGLATLTGGSLEVFDTPVQALSRMDLGRIGLVPQEDNLDPELSVRQNLEVYGRYFAVPRTVLARRVAWLLEFMQLTDRADARVGQLSGGMKRRLVLARAMVAGAELIILDEPTTGLDPQSRVLIWRQLLELKKRGTTLLLTTHYMDEAERLCDHIIVIDHGRILDEGAPEALIGRHVKGHVFELPLPLPEGLDTSQWDGEDIGNAMLVYVQDARSFISRLPRDTQYLHRPANLEDVFLRLTGRALRDT